MYLYSIMRKSFIAHLDLTVGWRDLEPKKAGYYAPLLKRLFFSLLPR